MKILRVPALMALLAGAGWWVSPPVVHAQMPDINLLPDTPTKTPEEKAADAKRDEAYRESLKKIPDAKTSNDPWGNVRGDTAKAAKAPKARSTSARKTNRTGGNAN